MYQVSKKDGSVEAFNRTKVVEGVTKAGGTTQEAEQVATEVETWLPSVATGGLVDVGQIKMKVVEALKRVNPTTAVAFENYKK